VRPTICTIRRCPQWPPASRPFEAPAETQPRHHRHEEIRGGETLQLRERHADAEQAPTDNVFAAIGFQPHFVEQAFAQQLQLLRMDGLGERLRVTGCGRREELLRGAVLVRSTIVRSDRQCEQRGQEQQHGQPAPGAAQRDIHDPVLSRRRRQATRFTDRKFSTATRLYRPDKPVKSPFGRVARGRAAAAQTRSIWEPRAPENWS
jgi:hypothetical protein